MSLLTCCRALVPIISALEHNAWFTKLNFSNFKMVSEFIEGHCVAGVVFITCVSYAEARNRYRLDVRLSVIRWYCIKMAEYIVMLSLPHDRPFILVLCISRSSRNSDGVTPCGGAKQRLGMIKPAIFQKHGASINRSIQRAINLVRWSTAINTLATTVRVSTVNSHFQSNEH